MVGSRAEYHVPLSRPTASTRHTPASFRTRPSGGSWYGSRALGVRALWWPICGILACRPAVDAPPPATAKVIDSATELLWGPSATGAIGDFVLSNGLILAVVTHDTSRSGFAASPGNLVDVVPMPDGEDHLNEVFLYLDDDFPRQARYEKVEIVSTGGGPREARIRASGVDNGDPRIRVQTDYVLRPGQHWLTLESHFTTTSSAPIKRYEIGDAIQWGRTEHMAPGFGFALPGRRVHVDWLAGIGRETSYALVPDGAQQFDTFSGSVWSDPIGQTVELVPKKTLSYVRHLVVGRGDTASLAQAIATLRSDPTGKLTGRIVHDGEPVRDARVWVLEAESEQIAGLARVDRNGWYTLQLRAGKYRLRVEAPGRTPIRHGDAVTLAHNETRVINVPMGAEGRVAWRIQGDDGRAPAVRITIAGLDDTPTPRLGPLFRADGAENHVLSIRGAGEVPLPEGRYRVIATRGPEFEAVTQEVQVRAGERTEVTGKLIHSVKTPGLISADLHQHAAPSFDSGVSLADRALSNAAEGVEVLVSTEHNVLVDYRPVIAAAGLGRVVTSIVGVEATTHSVGHFNAFPLQVQASRPRGGMIDPEGWTPRQIFDFVRGLGRPGIDVFVQANHPRSGKTGYFDMMKYDATKNVATDPRFATDFDGIEVVTFGVEKETQRALEDWFSLLRGGHRITATGTSDSHTISLRPVGWPRTYVCAQSDDPTQLDVAAFTRALKSGCATVSAGPVVTMRAGEVPMGGLLKAEQGQFEVQVSVHAAGWIGTDRLVLYLDGAPSATVPLSGGQPLRYQGAHQFRCSRDCFVVAWVDSATDFGPVHAQRATIVPRPVALTNPIYVDVDGDGVFNPQRGSR